MAGDTTGKLVLGFDDTKPCVYRVLGSYTGTIPELNVRRVEAVEVFGRLNLVDVDLSLLGTSYGCRWGGGSSALFLVADTVLDDLRTENQRREEQAQAKTAQSQTESDAYRAAKAERQKTMAYTVLQRITEPDPGALVEITDNQTGESGKFWTRNVFDFGYSITPEAKTFDMDSPFGQRVHHYLWEFPPISNSIRM